MESQERLKLQLKVMKVSHNVTTKQIAERAGMSYSHINHMITGKRVVSEKNFNMMMEAIKRNEN